GLTLHNLDRMIDGDLGELIAALQAADIAERLKESAIQATTAPEPSKA
ncbi:MAG: peptide chain release factor 1, partial [Verrucomicrobia bacterium]